ncbi:MAG: hypothetical protein M5U26_19525 [Planctomycetota bacterium]|nr:hypothetical protein [Planctomycetota bacterium]
MARVRSSDDAGESLELLLDTMCNAFGGIIFITFMVLLIPKGTDAAATPDDPGAPSEERLKELEQEQARLEDAVSTLQQERARRAEIRYARLPRLRKVEKGVFFVVLSAGRAGLPRLPGANGYNARDFQVAESPNAASLTPLPGRGEPLAAWLEAPQGLPALLKALPREQVLVHLIVYDDSVAGFTKLRTALTDAGFDYNWSPLKAGQPLKLTQGGSGNAEAQ